jgi:hypothetical protein
VFCLVTDILGIDVLGMCLHCNAFGGSNALRRFLLNPNPHYLKKNQKCLAKYFSNLLFQGLSIRT